MRIAISSIPISIVKLVSGAPLFFSFLLLVRSVVGRGK